MNNNDSPIPDERLEAYFEGRMPAEERAQFETLLAHNAQAADQVKLERQIDGWLRRWFAPPPVPTARLEELWKHQDQPSELSRSNSTKPARRWLLILTGSIAASVACALAAWQFGRRSNLEPYFRPRPLAEIYREMVHQGFRPYYFCEDEDRFRLTFESRQGVPLRLAELPPGRRMVGLSYAGGLSRNTTAILCYAAQQPVVVFVDRSEVDTRLAPAHADPDLRVFRRSLGDLVLYEVTPLEAPMIIDFLQVPMPKP